MNRYQILAVVIFALFVLPVILMGYVVMITGSGFNDEQWFVAFMFAIFGSGFISFMYLKGLLKGGSK